jgi:hypothetical protein
MEPVERKATLSLRTPLSAETRLKLEALVHPPPAEKKQPRWRAILAAIPKPSFEARFWRIAKVFAGLNPGCKEAAE